MDQAPKASAVLGRALHVPDLRVEHEGCVTEIADDGAAGGVGDPPRARADAEQNDAEQLDAGVSRLPRRGKELRDPHQAIEAGVVGTGRDECVVGNGERLLLKWPIARGAVDEDEIVVTSQWRQLIPYGPSGLLTALATSGEGAGQVLDVLASTGLEWWRNSRWRRDRS